MAVWKQTLEEGAREQVGGHGGRPGVGSSSPQGGGNVMGRSGGFWMYSEVIWVL